MINSVIEFVKNKTFLALAIASIVFLFLYWLFVVDKFGNGTWDKKFHYGTKEPIGTKRASGESKGEAECRYVLETIFNQQFSKTRPKFLFNNKTIKYRIDKSDLKIN